MNTIVELGIVTEDTRTTHTGGNADSLNKTLCGGVLKTWKTSGAHC